MSNNQEWSPSSMWRQFRLESETAKHYPTSYSLYTGHTHKDILLERLLPTLLYIKAASILDDSLAIWLTGNGYQIRKPYKDNFNGHICFIDDNSLYNKCTELHTIRKKRNNLAHDPGVSSDWQELENDIIKIEECLLYLGLIQETKKIEYFAERSAIQESEDPKIAFTRRFSYGVKQNGKLALEISWNENTYNN